MSLTLAVTVIVLADVALIGLLAFVMSRPRLLKPHVSSAAAADTPSHARTRAHARRRTRARNHVSSEDAPALPARA